MAILGYKSSKVKKEGLPGWLEEATDQLTPAARQRVSEEVEAHFADAVESHIANGESEPAARAAALAELGSPRKAGETFRKHHLTESELRWLHRAARNASRPFYSADTLWDLLGLATVLALLCFIPGGVRYWLAVLAAVLIAAGYRLIPRWACLKFRSGRNYMRGLAVGDLTLSIGFALIVMDLMSVRLDGHEDGYTTVGALLGRLLYLWMIYHRSGAPSWPKLWNLRISLEEFPPAQPASS
jgi:hypothetical protein